MEDQLTFPQTIDGLPAPIATLTPDGRIDFVTRRVFSRSSLVARVASLRVSPAS